MERLPLRPGSRNFACGESAKLDLLDDPQRPISTGGFDLSTPIFHSSITDPNFNSVLEGGMRRNLATAESSNSVTGCAMPVSGGVDSTCAAPHAALNQAS